MAAVISVGTDRVKLYQQQLQQWQASFAEYRTSTAAAQMQLEPNQPLQTLLGGGALCAYGAANLPGGCTAAPAASAPAVQTANESVARQPTARGLTRPRAVAFSLPQQAQTPALSVPDASSPTDSTHASEDASAPQAGADEPSAMTSRVNKSLAAVAASSTNSKDADVQQDTNGRSKRKRTQHRGVGQEVYTAQVLDAGVDLVPMSKEEDAKLRRKLSNRESARRSRQRKEDEEKAFQQRLVTSEAAANSLRTENAVLRQQLEQMTAVIGRLQSNRTALAAQVRSLGGEVCSELEAPVQLPTMPAASDTPAMQQQLHLQVPQQQSLVAGMAPVGVLPCSAGTLGLQQTLGL